MAKPLNSNSFVSIVRFIKSYKTDAAKIRISRTPPRGTPAFFGPRSPAPPAGRAARPPDPARGESGRKHTETAHRPPRGERCAGMKVRLIGLEPTRPKPPDPKSGASTNFATSAVCGAKLRLFRHAAYFAATIFRERRGRGPHRRPASPMRKRPGQGCGDRGAGPAATPLSPVATGLSPGRTGLSPVSGAARGSGTPAAM